MLDDAAMALIIVLIVMWFREKFEPSKALVGLALLIVGALVGLAQGAAQIYLPPWAYKSIVFGLAMALAGGTAYGLITSNAQAKANQLPPGE